MRKAFQRALTKQGFKFKLNTKVNSADITGDKVKLDLETKKGEKETLEADVVLVSAGSSFLCYLYPVMLPFSWLLVFFFCFWGDRLV